MTVINDSDAGPTTSEADAAAELLGTASTPAPAETASKTVVADDDEAVSGSLSEFEKRAAEAEEEAGLEPETKPSTPEAKKETAESQAIKARDARLQKIIDTKFGGDEEKFVASLYEQQNSAAALHRELQEIKKRLEAEPETPPSPEEHPDLAWIAEEITSLKGEVNSNHLEQKALVDEGKKINEDILRKEGELKRADEFDAKELKREIADMRRELQEKKTAWTNLDSRNKAITAQQRELARKKDLAEREVLSLREQSRNEERKAQESEAQEFKKFESAVDAVAKEFGIAEGEVYDDMYETVRARAAMHIRVNGPVDDLGLLTRALCEKYTKVHNIAKKTDFVDMSKEKAQSTRNSTTPPKAPADPQAPAPRVPEKKWTADFVRMRAAKILGG